MFVSMGYVALILPGLILHFFCVLGALSGNPWSEGTTTTVVSKEMGRRERPRSFFEKNSQWLAIVRANTSAGTPS